MSETPPKVVSSILNWNNYEDTAACLESLRDLSYPSHEILVVDNGSTDGSGDRLSREFPDVTVVKSDENLGFAGGHTLAIEEALETGADYVWVLNNDVLVSSSDLLDELVARFRADTSLGALSPLVRRYPNTDAVWFSQGRVEAKAGAAWHTNDASFGEGLVRDTEYIPFCATLFPTEVFEEVGPLPDDYFLYLEDADFCRRLLESGYDLAVDTDVEIHHKGSASSGGKVSPTSLYYIARNRWLFARRWADGITPTFVRNYLRWLTLQAVRCVYHNRPAGFSALVRGTRDGWYGTTGQGPYP